MFITVTQVGQNGNTTERTVESNHIVGFEPLLRRFADGVHIDRRHVGAKTRIELSTRTTFEVLESVQQIRSKIAGIELTEVVSAQTTMFPEVESGLLTEPHHSLCNCKLCTELMK